MTKIKHRWAQLGQEKSQSRTRTLLMDITLSVKMRMGRSQVYIVCFTINLKAVYSFSLFCYSHVCILPIHCNFFLLILGVLFLFNFFYEIMLKAQPNVRNISTQHNYDKIVAHITLDTLSQPFAPSSILHYIATGWPNVRNKKYWNMLH